MKPTNKCIVYVCFACCVYLWESSVQAQTEPPLSDQEQTVEDLKKEIAALKQALVAEGVLTGTGEQTLTKEQQDNVNALNEELADVTGKIDQLNLAIENGLDPSVVTASMTNLQNRKSELESQISQVVADEPESELDKLKSDVAVLQEQVSKLGELTKAKETLDNNGMEDFPVGVYAFGDMYYHIQQEGRDDFHVGQLEIDLELSLGKYIPVVVAVPFDAEAGTLGLGVFTAELRLVGADDGYLKKSDKIESFSIMAGMFDIPFGIAYLEYPSIDHRFVTSPIIVDTTHGAWNDLGFHMHIATKWLNGALYVTNGFPDGEVDPTLALGTRIGFTPLEPLELGGSVAVQFTADAEVDMVLAGADLNLEAGGFTLKGEYLYKGLGLVEDDVIATYGFYGQAMYDFNPVYVIGRYGQSYTDGEEWSKQLSGGLGVAISEVAEIRFEYTSDLENNGSIAFIQLAGGIGWQATGVRGREN